jgi:hypothetical protein
MSGFILALRITHVQIPAVIKRSVRTRRIFFRDNLMYFPLNEIAGYLIFSGGVMSRKP